MAGVGSVGQQAPLSALRSRCIGRVLVFVVSNTRSTIAFSTLALRAPIASATASDQIANVIAEDWSKRGCRRATRCTRPWVNEVRDDAVGRGTDGQLIA